MQGVSTRVDPLPFISWPGHSEFTSRRLSNLVCNTQHVDHGLYDQYVNSTLHANKKNLTEPDIILSPEWDPVEFRPQVVWREILSQPVRCIRAVCLLPPDYYHPNLWAFLLSTSEEDATAIRLECQPTQRRRTTVILQGSRARILFQREPVVFLVPNGAAATFVLRVNQGFTVGDIYSLIVTNDRHKYEIDEEGWNSRTWVYDQIDLFNQHGIFTNQGEVDIVKDALQKRWPGGVEPNPLEEGAYYG